MGYNVGMPVMKLDRNNHFGKKGDHSGNAKAVTCEALEERFSGDADLDRNMTEENLYIGYTSGEALTEYWEQMADDYRVIDKNGKEKKLRSDAGIGFAGICKPEMDFMDSLDDDQIEKFMNDSLEVIKEIYEKRGCVIDAAVVHYDEGNPHMHYFGHDPEYKLGKKLGLPLYTALNQTEYPEMMRQRGWEIENLTGYKEATVGMTDDEKEDYKTDCKKKRKHGRSSAEYKAEKKAKEIIYDAEVSAGVMKIDMKSKSKQLDRREKDLKAREDTLKAQEEALKKSMDELTSMQEKALKMQNEANEKYSEAEKKEEEYNQLIKDFQDKERIRARRQVPKSYSQSNNYSNGYSL